jgi:hypothetical protein
MRHDYVATSMTVAEICAKYRVSQYVLYMWLAGGPRVNGERMLPPVERRSPMRRKRTDREKLVQRLWRAASVQVRTLENRLNASPEPDESSARTMAVMVKTLRDLYELDGPKQKPKAKPEAESSPGAKADDPRDIDEFRRELARRIAALDPGRADDAAGGT